MRVRVPHVTLHPDTVAALDEHAPGWLPVPLGPGEDAYWVWLASEWQVDADTLLVEHDIVIHGGVVPGLTACGEPWCVHPYSGPAGKLLTESLGCTRFTADLKAVEADLLDVVGLIGSDVRPDDGPPARSWRRLDVRVATELRGRGHSPHVHEPAVGHRHHYDPPNGPCGCGCEGG